VLLWCVAIVGSAQAAYIDYSAKEINTKVVYYGSVATTAATDNLAYIYNKTNPGSKGKIVRAHDENDRTLVYDFLPLTLGKIRGFQTQVHLYTVPTAKDRPAARALILKGVDGIVFIADADPASAKINIDNLAELKSLLKNLGYDYDKLPIVFQLVGTTRKGAVSVAELTKSLGVGDHQVFEADVTTGVGVFDTLKAISKLVLLELKKDEEAAAIDAQPKKLKKAKPSR
jgi:hypothetical protein